MVEIDPQTRDTILSTPTVLELSVNELRILVDALDGLSYFGCTDGEAYLDDDGLKQRARLKREYDDLVNGLLLRSRFTLISRKKEQA